MIILFFDSYVWLTKAQCLEYGYGSNPLTHQPRPSNMPQSTSLSDPLPLPTWNCKFTFSFCYTSSKSFVIRYMLLWFVCACLCVCMSVCLSVSQSVNKNSAERMHRFGSNFCEILAYRIGSNPIEISDLWSCSQWRNTHYLIAYMLVRLWLTFILPTHYF